VNNEDLVEIIGNSNEPGKIIQHLSKMFAAMSNIELVKPDSIVVGDPTTATLMNALSMGSKEGEVVTFSNPIAVNAQVKEWLGVLEREMSITLAILLDKAHSSIPANDDEVLTWMDGVPAQVMILASQVFWTKNVETALGAPASEAKDSLTAALAMIESRLKSLSGSVLLDLQPSLRKKCEQLLTEMVHQRDVSRLLASAGVTNRTDFEWLYHLRFYWQPLKSISREGGTLNNLAIKMSNAEFIYGYEYLGITERLVETPLTARCYLTLTQALHFRMGGNPFGPAGTGKTESVKMLGNQLGRFVLVFNCDSSFDYAAMGRIFAGLCQVGAWGCFDEFNRLEERILSAVSQQILTIQRGLLMHQDSIELLGNTCKLNKDVGIFVTMNPGYAGRSNLPDNLKQLFRAVAMVVPDRKLIAQVMLFSQGIVTAEELAGKIVLLFTLLEEQLSTQSHYDCGLRALKCVLVGAG
jgi:dynein heavy chain 1